MWRTCGPSSAHAPTASSFSERAPAQAPKTPDDGRVAREPEPGAPVLPADVAVRPRDRAADDAGLRPAPAGNVVGEEEASGERRGEAVGQPEVRVRLRQRRRDAPQARGEHHRPRDEAARAEDDLRPAPGEDPQAVRRRGARPPGRAELSRAGRARQAGDGERVEREARLRHQPRLDAVWCPGERHGHSAVAERLRDRERRPHVAGCSPGRDHARELRRRGH